MSDCQFVEDEPLTAGQRRLVHCVNCGRSLRTSQPFPIRANCKTTTCKAKPRKAAKVNLVPVSSWGLPDEIAAAAEEKAAARGMLAGDLIAALTTAIGIPPCGGCEVRKEWLNRAHAWLRGD